MEQWEEILVALVVVFVVNWGLNQYIVHRRDVSDVYLEQQSVIGVTRKDNESSIYQSSKLENGLRGGLDIRYDHYKIRNGNMRDIWEVYLNQIKRLDVEREIYGDTWSIPVGVLNRSIEILSNELRNVKEIEMSQNDLFKTKESLVAMMTCLIHQKTINLVENANNSRLRFENGKIGEIPVVIVAKDEGHFKFENNYVREFDKGIAIKMSRKIGGIEVDHLYTQSNLVSAIASFLKHLPSSHSLSNKDKLEIVLSNTDDHIDILVKFLATFISGSQVKFQKSNNYAIQNSDASIVSISEKTFTAILPKEKTPNSVSQKLYTNLISKGIFPFNHDNNNLRLIYLTRNICDKPLLTSTDLNQYRAYLKSRIICENLYPGIAGAIILTDFYDYRVLNINSSYGCISQSDEIKLVATDGKNDGLHGEIYIRGYNISKTVRLSGQEEKIINKENDGFMPLGLQARWGNDGCLYIQK